MSHDDPPTLTVSNPSSTSMQQEAAPALSIIWHPDLSRVGAMFSFAELEAGQGFSLSRLSPDFSLYTDKAAPLADPYLSRRPFLKFVRTDAGVRVCPEDPAASIKLNGDPLTGAVALSSSALAGCVILTLARRIVLGLHLASPSLKKIPNLGFLGNSDSMTRLRSSILSVADTDLPVLITGETGTGKELAAAAFASTSSRAGKPYVAINMGAVPASTAMDELFGHQKGAFTGANDNRGGYFGEADTGTLFLDEIGLASKDVQAALLRVLESGEIRPLGARSSRRVDVRLLAATDAQLHSMVTSGAFSQPLFHRLSSFNVDLPPLRQRREDIGVLFLHFLREVLKQTGELARLDVSPAAKRSWFTGDAMAMVAMAPWTGNVRQLRNFATQLAVSNKGSEVAHLDTILKSFLDRDVPAAAGASEVQRILPLQSQEERILQALEKYGFEPSRVARSLNISRTTVYRVIDEDPVLRKAADLSDEELQRLNKECRGDLSEMSRRLRVSLRALKMRLGRS